MLCIDLTCPPAWLPGLGPPRGYRPVEHQLACPQQCGAGPRGQCAEQHPRTRAGCVGEIQPGRRNGQVCEEEREVVHAMVPMMVVMHLVIQAGMFCVMMCVFSFI